MSRRLGVLAGAYLLVTLSIAGRDLQAAKLEPVTDANLAALRKFQAIHDYDTAYLQKLAKDSPGAYAAFAQAEEMGAEVADSRPVYAAKALSDEALDRRALRLRVRECSAFDRDRPDRGCHGGAILEAQD